MDHFLAYPLEPSAFPHGCDLHTLARLRRTMSAEDQALFDDLVASVERHWPFSVDGAKLISLEHLLLTMLLEQHKQLKRLSEAVGSAREGPTSDGD